MGHGGEGRFEGCSKVVVSRPSFVSKPSCQAPHSFPSPSPPFASPWRRCCGPSHPCSQLTTQRDLGWATPPAHSSTAGETGGCCCSCRRWAGASCRRRTGSCCTAPVGRGSTHSGRNMIDDVKPTSARWVGGNGGDRISCRDVKHPSLEVGAGTGTRGFRAERAGRLQGCHTVFRPTILFRYPSRAQSSPPPRLPSVPPLPLRPHLHARHRVRDAPGLIRPPRPHVSSASSCSGPRTRPEDPHPVVLIGRGDEQAVA